jgi:hypothetical protein
MTVFVANGELEPKESIRLTELGQRRTLFQTHNIHIQLPFPCLCVNPMDCVYRSQRIETNVVWLNPNDVPYDKKDISEFYPSSCEDVQCVCGTDPFGRYPNTSDPWPPTLTLTEYLDDENMCCR